MNIRIDSKEIRFRINQDEVGALFEKGLIEEKIILPNCQICFQIVFGEQTRVGQSGCCIVFWLSPETQNKLKTPLKTKDPVIMIYEEIKGKKVCFKLEVDILNAKQREKRK